MRTPSLGFLFILALIAHVCGPLVFPSIRLMAFAPFLALALMRKELLPALWLCSLAGLMLDLTTSNPHFGLFAFSYFVTALATFRFRRHFYEEGLLSLPLFTILISFFWTLLFLLFGGFTPNLSSIASNLIVMPLFDALYAFFWFTCPCMMYNRFKKKPRRYS